MNSIRLGAVLSAIALLSSPLFAAFHLIYITEVFPGTPAAPDAQYVELQMYFDGQNLVAGHTVVVYDFNDTPIGTFVFPDNVPNGTNQATILIGTPAAATFFGVTPDLPMTNVIPAFGGKVCFAPEFGVDCVAWGGYRGSPTGVGTPFNVPAGLLRGQAMHRRLDIAGLPGVLDLGDDTNDCANDFQLGSPTPRNNSGVTGTIPGATCGNSVIEGLESCDDGNLVSGDGCSAACQWETAAVPPIALGMDETGNRVIEPNESVVVRPTWRNNGAQTINITANASTFGGPAGVSYTIQDAVGNYGSIASGTSKTCTDCYALAVLGASRPAPHWDATMAEVLSNGGVKNWTIHIGQSFNDVPASNIFYRFVETLWHRGVTSGCGANLYCPSSSVTRQQMAVFLLVSKFGSSHQPPAAVGIFADVPPSSPFAPWIEELAAMGVTAGCSVNPPLYCPSNPVTRQQMSVFLLKTLDPSIDPPAAIGMFNDVSPASPFARWIEELARRGVTAGCSVSPPLYCPTNPVTRAQMSAFLSSNFGLSLYSP